MPDDDRENATNKSYFEERGTDKEQEHLPKSTIYIDTREGSMNSESEKDQVSDGIKNENLGHQKTNDNMLLRTEHTGTADDAGHGAHRLNNE